MENTAAPISTYNRLVFCIEDIFTFLYSLYIPDMDSLNS